MIQLILGFSTFVLKSQFCSILLIQMYIFICQNFVGVLITFAFQLSLFQMNFKQI